MHLNYREIKKQLSHRYSGWRVYKVVYISDMGKYHYIKAYLKNNEFDFMRKHLYIKVNKENLQIEDIKEV